MKISVLTSGIGFGTYIPAMVLMHQLKDTGADVSVDVLEKLFLDEKKGKLLENQRKYHDDFKVAKVAMRIPAMKQQSNYDEEKVLELLRKWSSQKREIFILFSGNWQSILAEYEKKHKIHIYCVHMDCVLAPSWKGFSLDYEREAWLIGKEDELPEVVLYREQDTLPFKWRENRILIHGGGWGLGLPNLHEHFTETSGYEFFWIDTLQGEVSNAMHKHFWIGEWCAYQDTGRIFPPLYFGDKDINKNDEHYVYILEKNSKAIMSKAGGGTLCEAFSGNVPIILADSVAWHEEQNKNKWKNHGFGITFEEWKESGFLEDMLKDCYQRLNRYSSQTKMVLLEEICKWIATITSV